MDFPPLRDRYAKPRRDLHARPLKVGLVGAGKRVSDFYLPILQQLSDQYEIVGFTTRSAEGSRKFGSRTGIAPYENASALVERQKPGLLIVAAPDRVAEQTVLHLLDLKVPILAETPLAWSAAGVRRIIEKSAANQVLLGVAEQFPSLPLEQFRRLLLDLGAFGEVYAAFNDFHSYSYHGVAQLRRYLKGRPTSVKSVERGVGGPRGGFRWRSGLVTFSDGATLVHNYPLAGSFIRPSVHLHGSSGAMTDYEITLRNGHGEEETALAEREENPDGGLKSISATLPCGVGRVIWRNPFADRPFSDEQIAVATVLAGMAKAISEGSRPPYAAEDFLKDMEIVQGFGFSAEADGKVIRLPLNERLQKARALARPSFWKRKLLR